MDYKKLHKYTITKLQEMVNSGKITVEIARGICADFVPESEDERMRNAAINACKYMVDNFENSTKQYEDAIAWLEKQSEKAKYHEICDKCVRQPTCQSDCFLQQEWSEEDEAVRKDIIDKLERIRTTYVGSECDICKMEIDWLKSIKDRVQPKQEWSKEDEVIITKAESWLNTLCDYLKDSSSECIPDIKDVISELKSLRPQSHWKPSEEQMKALDNIIKNIEDDIANWQPTGRNKLISLYNDLKKV